MAKKIIFKLIKASLSALATWHRSAIPTIVSALNHIEGKGSGTADVSNEVKCIFNILNSFGFERPLILDIGANRGDYTEELLKYFPKSEIYLFEPSSELNLELDIRFAANKNIFICPIAMADKNSIRTLWSDKFGSTLGSLTQRDLDHAGLLFDKSEVITAMTLDSWTKENNICPDFIKIDVEGHELDVIQGGKEIMKEVKVVQFEFGGCNIDTRTYFKDFWKFFHSNNFALFRIAKDRAIEIKKYEESLEYFYTTNYVAIKGPK